MNLLNKAETASLLRISRRTLERERAAHRIRGVMVGGRVFFSREEIERYLRTRTDQFKVSN